MNPGREATVHDVDAAVVPLVNFHARVLDYCVEAAQKIVSAKLVEQSSIVQGPDPGPGAGEHPMTGLLATSMYKEIVEDLRRAGQNLGQKDEGGDGADKP